MHQKYLELKKSIVRQGKWRKYALLALKVNSGYRSMVHALKRGRKDRNNIQNMMKRTKEIQTVTLNLNSLSELQIQKDFRFFLLETRTITENIGWSDTTSRSGCVCETTTATAMLLYKLATTSRKYDAEMKFGIHLSKLSEIFWEQVESLNSKGSTLLGLRNDLLQTRRGIYAQAIRNAGAPFKNVLGSLTAQRCEWQDLGV